MGIEMGDAFRVWWHVLKSRKTKIFDRLRNTQESLRARERKRGESSALVLVLSEGFMVAVRGMEVALPISARAVAGCRPSCYVGLPSPPRLLCGGLPAPLALLFQSPRRVSGLELPHGRDQAVPGKPEAPPLELSIAPPNHSRPAANDIAFKSRAQALYPLHSRRPDHQSGFRGGRFLKLLHKDSNYPPTRFPPVFLYNLTDSNPVQCSFSFEVYGDENSRRIAQVLLKKTGKNPLLVGTCNIDALRSFTECINKGKGSSLPAELAGLSVSSAKNDISEFFNGGGSEDKLGLKFKELGSAAEQCSGLGIVVNFGDLKALIVVAP